MNTTLLYKSIACIKKAAAIKSDPRGPTQTDKRSKWRIWPITVDGITESILLLLLLLLILEFLIIFDDRARLYCSNYMPTI